LKNATTSNGTLALAGPDAPETAVCPQCHETVYLRRRRRMGDGELTYFWQHERGGSRNCHSKRRVRGPAVAVRA
jgi:hypothetical protein